MSDQTKPAIIQETEKALPEIEQVMGLTAPQGSDLHAMALQELDNLHAHSVYNPTLFKDVDTASVAPAVKTALRQGLTLDPNAGLVYLMTRNVKDDQNNWRKVLETRPSPNGILSIAYQTGQILDHKNPTAEEDAEGKVVKVRFEFLVPSHPDPRWEVAEFDESDFRKWRIASHKQRAKGKNKGSEDASNGLYSSHNGSIDPEFAKSKAIRHGLKRRGINPNAPVRSPRGDRGVQVVPPEKAREEVADEYGEPMPTTDNPQPETDTPDPSDDTPSGDVPDNLL